MSAAELRFLMALFVAATFVRLVPLNHPSFFHPDLRTHARIAAVVRADGARFFRNPYASLWRPTGDGGRVASGMWIKSLGGEAVGLPYAVAFHSMLAPWGLSEDAAVTAIRVTGGAFAALAPVLVFFLARALLLSTWVAGVGAVLAVAVPSLSAELANAAVPACLGHLCDLTFLTWLVTSLRSAAETGRPWPPSRWLRGAAGLAACYLAYTSSLVVSTLLLAALAVFAWTGVPALRPLRHALVWVLALGAASAIALYYWSFVPATFHAVAAVASGRSGASQSGAVRTFGSVWPALVAWAAPLGVAAGAFGVVRLLRVAGVTQAFFSAALTALLLVGLARSLAPQVFGWVHDALFAGPLLCLALALALAALKDRGRVGLGLARLLIAALLFGGLVQYARLLQEQAVRAL